MTVMLTTKARDKMPKKEFGEPSKRAYPMPDKSHAANAKARATQMEEKGKLSDGEKSKIDAKANKVLGEGKKKESMNSFVARRDKTGKK